LDFAFDGGVDSFGVLGGEGVFEGLVAGTDDEVLNEEVRDCEQCEDAEDREADLDAEFHALGPVVRYPTGAGILIGLSA
jgi:hypothetical protein